MIPSCKVNFDMATCHAINSKALNIVSAGKLPKSLTVTELCVIYYRLSAILPDHKSLASKAWAVVSLADACWRQQAWICSSYHRRVCGQISKKELFDHVASLFEVLNSKINSN